MRDVGSDRTARERKFAHEPPRGGSPPSLATDHTDTHYPGLITRRGPYTGRTRRNDEPCVVPPCPRQQACRGELLRGSLQAVPARVRRAPCGLRAELTDQVRTARRVHGRITLLLLLLLIITRECGRTWSGRAVKNYFFDLTFLTLRHVC